MTRASPRQAEARQTEVRDEVRLAPGEGRRRDGTIIRRQSVSDDGSKYGVPAHIIETHKAEGFDLEWKRTKVFGEVQHQYIAQTARGGWEAVQAERWPGIFLPEGATGAIEIDGLMLMERPIELSLEARREDKDAAREAANRSRRNIGIKELAPGFEDHNNTSNAKVRANSFARSELTQVEAAKPKYNYGVEAD